MRDVLDAEEYKRLLERANYDDLTKVLTRRAGREHLEDLLLKAKEEHCSVVVMLCDVNDLKAVNDSFGHKEGDRMLKLIASALSRPLEAQDIVFRLSGDEFVLVFYGINQSEIQERLKEIQEHLQKTKAKQKITYETSFSYGLLEIYPGETYTVSEVIEAADKKMYIQKRNYHIQRSKRLLEQQSKKSGREFDFNCEFLYEALVESSDDYIFIGNMKTGAFRYPAKMVKQFGLPSETLENAAAFWSEKVHPHDVRRFLENNQDIADGRTDSHDIEYRAKSAKGEWVWLRCRGKVIRDREGMPDLFAGMIVNLGRKDQIDQMTGLYNRYQFEGDAKKNLVDEKYVKHMGIMVLDMDGFGNLNELYNHSFGDAILRQTARKMGQLLPEHAKIYRMDGDEFAILFLNGSKETDLEVFSKIQSVFQQSQNCEGQQYFCTLSAGYVSFPQDSTDYQELLQYAYYALENSKARGKNRIVAFSQDILEGKSRKLVMAVLLRESIGRGFSGFSVHYQPQIVSETGELYGTEALARWNCTHFGEVPPTEFIHVLEESGMIIQVGRWIFREAAKQCSEWVKLQPSFHMSVNLSYLQIMDEEFMPFIRDTIHEFGLSRENITLELTETYLIEKEGIVHDVLRDLRSKGIQSAMDDFGMGYSSLFELKHTPADIVKIDRGFVEGLTSDTFTASFIHSITDLCHDVGKKVCMEGIETEEEYEIMKEIGVDLIQGFFFGKPMTAECFERRFML